MPVPQRASREKPTRSNGLWCMVLFCCDAIYVRVCVCVCAYGVAYPYVDLSCACVVPRVAKYCDYVSCVDERECY